MAHNHDSNAQEIKQHFDKIAPSYDKYKRRAWYYYDWLKRIIRSHIGDSEVKRILDVGSGTGEILAFLNPKRGLGIDVSKRMVNIARQKYKKDKKLSFQTGSAEILKKFKNFDIILLSDVIEHLSNVEETFSRLSRITNKSAKIIVTMINPLWEPIMMFGENLGMKMPEGPHNRISINEISIILAKSGLRIKKHSFYVLVPIYIPLISNFVNGIFNKLPLVRNIGLIEVLEITRQPTGH